MLSDDVFRARLQAAIASIVYWKPQIADVAKIEETNAPEYWKINVTPHVANACPFELMLRADQKYDLMVAGEAVEDQDIDDLGLFLPLVDAIASGKVVQRISVSQMTGIQHVIETLVFMPGGKVWQQKRQLTETLPPQSTLETQVRQFLAYRREAA
jgi:hypothetical protein